MNKQNTGSYNESNPQILSPLATLPVFDDTLSVISEEGHYWQREMKVDGKSFTLRSFFQPVSVAAPIDKLLHMIDSNVLKKD